MPFGTSRTTESGRFIGWESKDGLRRFRPPAEKSGFGIEANFEQRANSDVSWGKKNTEALRSNMHVETSQKFDYFSMPKNN